MNFIDSLVERKVRWYLNDIGQLRSCMRDYPKNTEEYEIKMKLSVASVAFYKSLQAHATRAVLEKSRDRVHSRLREVIEFKENNDPECEKYSKTDPYKKELEDDMEDLIDHYAKYVSPNVSL